MMLPALARAAFGTLDPKLRPEGSALINLSRLYGSTIGIAVVQLFFYANTQAVHIALAKHLMKDERQGILHVIGPEQGITLPGMTGR